MPPGGGHKRLREFLMGGCKRLETEIARIYVCSLCHWAVAASACVSSGLAVLGAAEAVVNRDCANLRSLAVPLGSCRKRLREFLLGSLC